MAANLTPQFHKAQEQYRKATTPDEELRWLQEMLKELPKHKASENMQSDLKSKISKVKKEIASGGKSSSSKHSVKIPRQGAGTVILFGGPNAGKSQFLCSVSKAKVEVADFPFTTRTASPAMMPFEDVMIQLIDTPPVTADYMEDYIQGMIRGADLVLFLVDLGTDDGIEYAAAAWERLMSTKTKLARESGLDEDDLGVSYTKTLVVLNKMDDEDAQDRKEFLEELLPLDFETFEVSCTEGTGLEELKVKIFESLQLIRIYTKHPKEKEPDFEKPFTLPIGSNLLELAEHIHKDLAEELKYAKIWGTGVHDGQTISNDHVLHDKDIVELHK